MKKEARAKAVAVSMARFVRRANGRVSKKELRKVATLYAVDLHYRFGGTDWLEMRRPGSFAEHVKKEKRYPGAMEELRAFAKDKFFHYGPRSGAWPGDTWVFTGTGWVVKEAVS